MPKIKVYSTPSCPWCTRLKEFLEELKVDFEEVNIAESAMAANEMVSISGQRGVPVTEIDGQVIIGFNPDAIKKALKIEEE